MDSSALLFYREEPAQKLSMAGLSSLLRARLRKVRVQIILNYLFYSRCTYCILTGKMKLRIQLRQFLNNIFQFVQRIPRGLERLTALFALIAAVGGIWAAHESRRAADVSAAGLVLELSPALQLDCNLDTLGRHPTEPTEVLFIKRGEAVQVQLSKIKTYSSDGRLFMIPSIFFRCALVNYGKMPAFDITVRFPIEHDKLNDKGSTQDVAIYNIPALASGSADEFAIAGWDTVASVTVRTPTKVKFRTTMQVEETEHDLFLSRWARSLGSGKLPPSPKQAN